MSFGLFALGRGAAHSHNTCMDMKVMKPTDGCNEAILPSSIGTATLSMTEMLRYKIEGSNFLIFVCFD